MNTYFEKYAWKGNEFLELLAEDLQVATDVPRAARVLRCVFHTLRENLPVAVSLQFIAQLPLAIKAFYVDGWKLSHNRPHPLSKPEDFIEAVVSGENPRIAGHDFNDKDDAIKAIYAVFRTVRRYVSEGEWGDVVAVMPAAIQQFLQRRQEDKFHIL